MRVEPYKTYKTLAIIMAVFYMFWFSPVFADVTISPCDPEQGVCQTDAALDYDGVGYTWAQSFTATQDGDVSNVAARFRRSGFDGVDPKNPVRIRIFSDNGGVPDVAIGTSATQNVTDSACDTTQNWAVTAPVVNGSVYWIVADAPNDDRVRPPFGTPFFRWCGRSTNNYAGGSVYRVTPSPASFTNREASSAVTIVDPVVLVEDFSPTTIVDGDTEVTLTIDYVDRQMYFYDASDADSLQCEAWSSNGVGDPYSALWSDNNCFNQLGGDATINTVFVTTGQCEGLTYSQCVASPGALVYNQITVGQGYIAPSTTLNAASSVSTLGSGFSGLGQIVGLILVTIFGTLAALMGLGMAVMYVRKQITGRKF